MNDELKHYGTPRHSGRYPWGSGDNPYQSSRGFMGRVKELRSQGMSDTDIAKSMGMNTRQFRAKISIESARQKAQTAAEVYRLKEKGYSNTAIASRLEMSEASVRNYLSKPMEQRASTTETISNLLKDNVSSKVYVDVGVGVERHLGISRTQLLTSIEALKEEGYTIHYVPVEQLGTGKKTTMMVLASPDTDYKEVWANRDNIKMIPEYSQDGGRTFLGIEPPKSVSSNRIEVRYGDEGGTDKDGVIELRRGVEDISLGDSQYAQVRIAVDGTHYLKGMAMYSDDLPDGVDIRVNSNKKSGTPLMSDDPDAPQVLKSMKRDKETGEIDPDNPFGATIKQRHYLDSNGKDQLSALNIVNEEGEWGKWSKTLASQMLSKQSPELAKRQLNLALADKNDEFNEIMSLTNPVVKQKLLTAFADDCDASSVHLKAAALPRQASHVILPFPDMSENEIYAPNYRNGEKVVLIRYPHGGIFEIPELTVNNNHPTANSTIRNALDAVGIHPKVAEQLSGADFDGDTVLVIPNRGGMIKTSAPLQGLKDFNPKEAYPHYEGMPKMSTKTKEIEMGKVSNLITDMTIKGATVDEIARAVRHSMVVIDAEKHYLNYKQSYIDNGIAQLKEKYQGVNEKGQLKGASTIISAASSEKIVGARKERIDPKTGKKIYEYTGESWVDKEGKTHEKVISSTKMAEIDDARKLSSGTRIESVYATYANTLKGLANKARKAALGVDRIKVSQSAKETYAPEVSSLKAKLNIALKNAPLERQAQVIANSVVKTKKLSNPDMDKSELKRLKGQALAAARMQVGAGKQRIDITEKEWKAIQSGAVSHSLLNQILDNTDLDKVKSYATPRTQKGMTDSKIARAKAMAASGYTQAEIADQLGVSTSTIARAISN